MVSYALGSIIMISARVEAMNDTWRALYVTF